MVICVGVLLFMIWRGDYGGLQRVVREQRQMCIRDWGCLRIYFDVAFVFGLFMICFEELSEGNSSVSNCGGSVGASELARGPYGYHPIS